MKKESRKLSLNRETLATLQSDELEGVVGGAAKIPPKSVPASIPVKGTNAKAVGKDGAGPGNKAVGKGGVPSFILTRH